MEVVKETDVYPRLRLRCSGKRADGERHTFYILGVNRRIGGNNDEVKYVRCPYCNEKVTGGIMEPVEGYVLVGQELKKVDE